MANFLSNFLGNRNGSEQPNDNTVESPNNDDVISNDDADDNTYLNNDSDESDNDNQGPQGLKQKNEDDNNPTNESTQDSPTNSEADNKPNQDVEARRGYIDEQNKAVDPTNFTQPDPNADPNQLHPNQASTSSKTNSDKSDNNNSPNNGDVNKGSINNSRPDNSSNTAATAKTSSTSPNNSQSTKSAPNEKQTTSGARQAVANGAKKTSQVAANTAKSVGKAAARGAQLAVQGAEALIASGPVGWIILALITALLVGIIIFVIFLAISKTGYLGGTPKEGSTQSAQMELAANGGDLISKRALDAQDIPKLNILVDKISAQAQTKSDTEVVGWCNDIKTKLATYTSNPNSQTDAIVLKEVRDLLTKISAKGYGSYISTNISATALVELQKNIDAGKITFDSGHEADKAGIVKGVIKRCSSKGGEEVAIDPQIIILLNQIAKEHKINISSIIGCHSKSVSTGGVNVSQHWNGHAMDINWIDGQHVAPGNGKTKELMDWLVQNNRLIGVQIFQTIGPTDMITHQIRRCAAVATSGGGVTDSGHNNHIHIGVYQAGNSCQ